MPDMRTAFSNAFNRAPDIQKAIAEWEDTEAQPIKTQEKQMPYTPQATSATTVAEATYNYIKGNPCSTRQQILEGMGAKGYNIASVTTMLSQGRMCGTLLRDSDDKYVVLHNSFRPITTSMMNKARKAKQKAKREVVIGIAALKQQPRVEQTPAPSYETVAMVTSNTSLSTSLPATHVQPTDIDALLNSLTFNQAIGLYKKLKTLLGEV